MQYRRLGDSGMKISTIALGGWINFGENKVDDDIARQVVETAYAQGINFFDIADVYGKGEAEKQMGAVLKQYPRHTLVISTKVFFPMSDHINDRGLSRKHIFESIDRSLKNIGTDYIDIYFCHRPDPETPIIETARAMNDLINMGKVLYWGTSEWTPAQITEAYEIAMRYGWHPPKTDQPQYSMLHRERIENQVLPVTVPRGIGLVVFSPLGQGMLTGKYDDGVPSDSRFAREQWAADRFINERNASIVRNLKPIADGLGITRAQLALAWVLARTGVSSAITSATRPEQVIDSAKAADVRLTADVVNEIERVLSAQN